MSPNNHDDTITPALLDRREAIKRVSALFGGVALVGGSALWTACAGDRPATNAAASNGTPPNLDVALLDEIADTILPTTAKSPGAKSAQVGAFIALMVTDCYTTANQAIVRNGLATLNDACRAAHGTSFMDTDAARRTTLLEGIDRDCKQYMDTRASDAPVHYFRMLKELSLLGFFTSEIGYTTAMRYVESPGRFDPCVPYAPGETIWANHA